MVEEDTDRIPSLTVEETADRQAAGARLIDVREPVEWDAGHARGAELKPMTAIDDWYPELDPHQELAFICRSGNRSGVVVEALISQAGFTNARNVTGGMLAWAEAGLPVEAGA